MALWRTLVRDPGRSVIDAVSVGFAPEPETSDIGVVSTRMEDGGKRPAVRTRQTHRAPNTHERGLKERTIDCRQTGFLRFLAPYDTEEHHFFFTAGLDARKQALLMAVKRSAQKEN